MASDENDDGCGTEEGLCRSERGFGLLSEPSFSADPGKEVLHDPAAWMDCEADLVRRLLDDLDGDDRRAGEFVTGIAGIGEGFGDEGTRAPRQAQDLHSPVAILRIGGMGSRTWARPSVSTEAWHLGPFTVLSAS